MSDDPWASSVKEQEDLERKTVEDLGKWSLDRSETTSSNSNNNTVAGRTPVNFDFKRVAAATANAVASNSSSGGGFGSFSTNSGNKTSSGFGKGFAANSTFGGGIGSNSENTTFGGFTSKKATGGPTSSPGFGASFGGGRASNGSNVQRTTGGDMWKSDNNTTPPKIDTWQNPPTTVAVDRFPIASVDQFPIESTTNTDDKPTNLLSSGHDQQQQSFVAGGGFGRGTRMIRGGSGGGGDTFGAPKNVDNNARASSDENNWGATSDAANMSFYRISSETTTLKNSNRQKTTSPPPPSFSSIGGSDGAASWLPPTSSPTKSLSFAANDANNDSNRFGDGDASDEIEKPLPKSEIALLNKLVHKKLEDMPDVSVQVPTLQNDPLSPLYSIKTFEDLRLQPELLKALYAMGFHQPSKIQEAALPILLIEPPQNMIAQSQSGTGKTAAFVLTMLSRVNQNEQCVQCICLAPTYELAMQIGEVVKEMSQFMPKIKMRYAIRGETLARGSQIEEQIVIGTPGKMLDWLVKYRCIDAAKVKCFVLDEADVMISEQGHQDQSVRIRNAIEHGNPACQCMLFSATYDEQVFKFAESIIKNPVIITLRREEQTLNNIKQYYVLCRGRDEKYQAVLNLYSGLTVGSSIIFCHTRKCAQWLADRLRSRQHAVALLSGDLDIAARANVIKEFRDGVHKLLITTNVCARGIDVTQVTLVINYDMPVTLDNQPDYETYLHRIGRTGRFGKSGIAINFCDSESVMEIIRRIADHFGHPIEKLEPEDIEQLEAIEKEE